MADTQQQQDWPDRKLEILIPTTTLCVLSSAVLVWRVVVGLRQKRKLMLCDYLLIVAAMMNVASTGIRFKTTHHGQGRHLKDPSISKPDDFLKYSYYLWIGQIMNLIAVAVLKYSICAYLLALKFSRVYLGVVWLSILMVTTLNLLLPMMSVFCRTPVEANWNRSLKGKCFMRIGGMGVAYTQGVSNIVTDVVYVVAPIIYLSTIQLSRRTQWGLRVVFCLGLIATACSIVKTIEMGALQKTQDPTWTGSNLSIWSSTELSVGVLIASLPPLRKQFESLCQRFLPSSLTMGSSKSRTRSGGEIPLYNTGRPFTIGSKPSGGRGYEDDEDSERHILERKGEITKTVVHTVRTEDREFGIQIPSPTYHQYRESI